MDTFARRLLLGLAFAALAAATVATTVAAAPARQSAGTLTFCTDATYPPEEFYEGTKLVGSDIDIGTEVARRIGHDGEVPEHRLRRDHRGAAWRRSATRSSAA